MRPLCLILEMNRLFKNDSNWMICSTTALPLQY